jgi:chromatin assembly factor 1 subunit A
MSTETSSSAPPLVTPQAKQEAPKVAAKIQRQMQEEASTKRSAAAFAKFFTKRQPLKAETLLTSGSRGASEEASTTPLEFNRVFHPFVLKKNMTIAPTNWFSRRRQDVIVIDQDDCGESYSSSAKGCLT